MTGKIFRSIFLVVMCMLFACFALFLGILYEYFTGAQESQLETSLLLSAKGVEENGMAYFDNLEADCRLTWVNPEGTVLYDSASDAESMENHKEREEIQEALEDGKGESVRYSTTLMEKNIYQAVRLSDGSVLRISQNQATVLLLVLGMIQPIALILLAAIVLALLLAKKLAGNIMMPLESMNLEQLPEEPPYEELEPFLRKMKLQQVEIASQKKELAEKRLSMEFAEQNRREFTANVSHELKTPLQSIMGSAELMENGMVKQEDIPRFSGRIRKESERLLALIQDIIHLSRLDEGAGHTMEPVDVVKLAEEEMDALEPRAKEQNVTMNLVSEPVTMDAVPQLMREILHNLCDNAIKYNVPGGNVTLRIAQDDKHVIMAVSDTGIGISEEYQSHVFERFYRVDKSRSKETGGTGLGLSIVKHAVEYMNGEISLESIPNVGTTITIRFPKEAKQ